LYKYLRAFNSNHGVFGVSLSSITDLFQKAGIFDKHFKISDLDLGIKACVQGNSIAHISKGINLVRHEFLELMFRVSMDKFIRSGLYKNEAEGLARFFQKDWILNVNTSDWRALRYYNEECDNILTANKEILNIIYAKFKDKDTKNDKKGMTVDEFISGMQEHGFINEKFSIRYAAACFHFALITRIDEISANDHTQMSFIEFLEAFARVSDLLDSKDLEKDILKGFDKENPSLDKKIESNLLVFGYLKHKTRRK
jgi:NLR family CARD domain-containing protein 3